MKAAAGVITFLATVTGVIIAIQSRPAPYTLADWSTKANAVCDKDYSQPHLPLLQSLFALQSFATSGLRNQADANQAVLSISTSADGFRKLIGDLRALQVPDGYSGAINQLLNRGEIVSSYLTSAATDLQNGLSPAASRTTKLRSLGRAVSALEEIIAKALPAWERSLKSLSLTHCP